MKIHKTLCEPESWLPDFKSSFNEAHILAKLSRAPANQAAIGGLKVVTENGWFAARVVFFQKID